MLAVLAASLGPAAACAGAAVQARRMAVQQTATSEAFVGTLLENTARGERARISRELHDVVAHHVSMIAVQAETARLATPGMPAAGAHQLAAIGDTARAALTEMRRLLGVLREDSGVEAADRQPQPGLAQLNELLDEARDVSGIGARLIVSGWMTTLDPGVELAAYRIVQEALTNARRHAPGAAVDVELHYAADALQVRIRDNGPGPAAEPSKPSLGSRPARHAGTRRGRRRRVPRGRGAGRRLPGPGRAAGEGRGCAVTGSVPSVKIVVADDHQVVRAGFAALLNTQPDFTVLGTACDGAEALQVGRDLRPDVILMDVRMPGIDGIEATRQLTAVAGAPRVIILTTFDLDEYVYEALRAGASGFLLKDVTAERLFDAVRVVAAGEALLAPAVTRRLISEFARLRAATPARSAAIAELTPRETEVLRLLAEGLSNPEIAGRLVITEETVKTHVSRVLHKLGLRDRAQAVVLAYESGLVRPGSSEPLR